MTQITIHRALQQLKTLDARIENAIASTQVIAVAVGEDKRISFPASKAGTSEKDIKELAVSSLQTVVDLIAHRQKLKVAIHKSNALTMFKVAGKDMSVAEAIEAKRTAVFNVKLIQALRSQLLKARSTFNSHQTEMEKEITAQLTNMNSRNSNTKVSDTDLALATRSAKMRFEPALIDPIGLEQLIETMVKAEQDFADDIDASLSESNAVTVIEI